MTVVDDTMFEDDYSDSIVKRNQRSTEADRESEKKDTFIIYIIVSVSKAMWLTSYFFCTINVSASYEVERDIFLLLYPKNTRHHRGFCRPYQFLLKLHIGC